MDAPRLPIRGRLQRSLLHERRRGPRALIHVNIGSNYEGHLGTRRSGSSYENCTEYRWQHFSFVGRCLVPARNQFAPWKFHDWTDSVGGLWRYRGCIGHCSTARSQSTAKRPSMSKKEKTMNLVLWIGSNARRKSSNRQ